ncbi:MAG: enoyl-CoA hydratase/isomerase family protein, partial [Bacteroidia bacterium]
MYNNILYTVNSGIATITINRESQMNALTIDTIQEVGLAVAEANNDNTVFGIILTGAGNKAFIAGADIKEFSDFSVEEAEDMSASGHDVFNAVENSAKPVIAAVNGFALGGGCELAMACHMRIASENAKFGQPEVNLGLIPGYGGTQRLIKLAGHGKALELLMT